MGDDRDAFQLRPSNSRSNQPSVLGVVLLNHFFFRLPDFFCVSTVENGWSQKSETKAKSFIYFSRIISLPNDRSSIRKNRTIFRHLTMKISFYMAYKQKMHCKCLSHYLEGKQLLKGTKSKSENSCIPFIFRHKSIPKKYLGRTYCHPVCFN